MRPSRCAWPLTCAFPARISLFLELQPVGQSSFLGRAPRSRGSRAGGRARPTVGWWHRCEGARDTSAAGRGGWRAGASQCVEGCGLGPSCSGDVPGPPGPRPREKPTSFAVCLAAPLLCEAGEIAGSLRMRCSEALVQGGCLGGCCPDSETDPCWVYESGEPPRLYSPCFDALC